MVHNNFNIGIKTVLGVGILIFIVNTVYMVCTPFDALG